MEYKELKTYSISRSDGLCDVKPNMEAMSDPELAIGFSTIGQRHTGVGRGGVYSVMALQMRPDGTTEGVSLIGGIHCTQRDLDRIITDLHESGWKRK
jgi:hypothetical protein